MINVLKFSSLRHARASTLVRWFAVEFFSIAFAFKPSSIVTNLGRLAGVAAMLVVVRVSISPGLASGALTVMTQYVCIGALAILFGNVARELAIELGARVLGWSGREYRRTGVRLDGKIYTETLYPDGTWYRSERGPLGTVCEWTDRSGACNRIVTAPRKCAPLRRGR